MKQICPHCKEEFECRGDEWGCMKKPIYFRKPGCVCSNCLFKTKFFRSYFQYQRCFPFSAIGVLKGKIIISILTNEEIDLECLPIIQIGRLVAGCLE